MSLYPRSAAIAVQEGVVGIFGSGSTPIPIPTPIGAYRKMGGPNMKWITRSHVHVDRVACPWLISRFVDSEAEFLVRADEPDRRTVREDRRDPVRRARRGAGASRRPVFVRDDHRELRADGQGAAAPGAASSTPRTPRIWTTTRSRGAWRPSPWATACVFPTTRKIWRTSSRSMTRCMPGAVCRWGNKRKDINHEGHEGSRAGSAGRIVTMGR